MRLFNKLLLGLSGVALCSSLAFGFVQYGAVETQAADSGFYDVPLVSSGVLDGSGYKSYYRYSTGIYNTVTFPIDTDANTSGDPDMVPGFVNGRTYYLLMSGLGFSVTTYGDINFSSARWSWFSDLGDYTVNNSMLNVFDAPLALAVSFISDTNVKLSSNLPMVLDLTDGVNPQGQIFVNSYVSGTPGSYPYGYYFLDATLSVTKSVFVTSLQYGGFNFGATGSYKLYTVAESAAAIVSKYGSDGYDSGYQEGYSDGYDRGLFDGYDSGYNAAKAQYDKPEFDVVGGLLGSVVDVPLKVLQGLSPMVIWNTPIIGIILSFIFIGLILWVVKRFI